MTDMVVDPKTAPSGRLAALAQPLALERELANPPVAEVQRQQLVSNPGDGVQAPELSRTLALAPKDAQVLALRTEDPYLAIQAVGHEHGTAGSQSDAVDGPERFRPIRLQGGLRPDGDDPRQVAVRWRRQPPTLPERVRPPGPSAYKQAVSSGSELVLFVEYGSRHPPPG